MVTLLTGEALEVIDVVARAHHHLEGWNHFIARSAVARVAEQPVNNNISDCIYIKLYM